MNRIPAADPNIRIKAFSKQVGGHTQIFFNSTPDSTSELWKPLEQRERDFYESAQGNPTLCSLIPEYYGSYTLHASQITLKDKPAKPPIDSSSSSSSTSTATAPNSDNKSDDEIPAFSVQTTNDLSVALSRLPTLPPIDPDSDNFDSEPPSKKTIDSGSKKIIDPASKKIIGRASEKTDDFASKKTIDSGSKREEEERGRRGEPRYPFLVIRDVTTFCVHPCVFDIKLGVRQYADDAPPEKVRSHTLKAQRSTSAKLGCRACGCCAWDCVRRKKVYINKYAGQNGTEFPAFMAIVRSFFENGTGTPRRDAARALADGVERIAEVVEDRERFPFRVYSASLIVVYDGGTAGVGTRTEAKLIDFATVYRLKGPEDVVDDGVAMGLRNVIKAFREV